MNRKFSIALSLAAILAMIFTSLVLADVPPAHLVFTTDLDLPCKVEVDVFNFTNPAGQPMQSATGLASKSAPWPLDAYPLSQITFGYQTPVVCNGITYNLLSVSSSGGSLNTAGDSGTTTTMTGHYFDTTPPVWDIP